MSADMPAVPVQIETVARFVETTLRWASVVRQSDDPAAAAKTLVDEVLRDEAEVRRAVAIILADGLWIRSMPTATPPPPVTPAAKGRRRVSPATRRRLSASLLAYHAARKADAHPANGADAAAAIGAVS